MNPPNLKLFNLSKELLNNAQLRMQNAQRTTKNKAFNYLG
jgi:hypothetical protein